MEIKELGHVVLYVRDLDRSVHFYRDVLGFNLIHPTGGRTSPVAVFNSASGRTHHELLLQKVAPDAAPIPEGPRVGLYHIALKVGDSDDELRDALAKVQGEGVKVVAMTDHTVSHSVYILDPDGNQVELFIDVPGLDWKNDPSVIVAMPKPLVL